VDVSQEMGKGEREWRERKGMETVR